MNNVYSVVFKDNGKSYNFKSDLESINRDEYVIVETEKGLQIGKVLTKINSNNSSQYKSILRIASSDDIKQYHDNLKDADIALKKARRMASELNLEMNIIDASFTFDRNQLLFNFISDDRVDFRELAKKIAGIYRTRIELRQIGARDKAREVCGIGPCGRKLCCSSFLKHIDSVTMNMAKNQNLALNPTKINGSCGRLMCCLTYEDDEYSNCQNGMPYVGQTVKIKQGSGKVVWVDILNRKYKVNIDNEIVEVLVDEREKSNK